MLRIVPAQSEKAISRARDLFREYGAIPGVAPCLEDYEREVVSLPGRYAPAAGRLLLALEESPGNPE
jgi:putative acetyltransferase